MNKYERIIDLKTLWTTILRRWHVFFIIFIPIALISYIVTDKMLTKTYISSVTISRGVTITQTYYSVVQSYFLDESSEAGKEGAVYLTNKKLKEEEFFHKNGSEITMAEITSGIIFPSLPNTSSTSISISFQSPDNLIAQRVLDELSKNAVANIKARAGADYTSTSIVGSASLATKNSKETTYFLIALAAGFVVAFAIPFIDEIVGDEVYDKYDIESLGCSAFEIKAKTKKKEA